MLFVVDNFIKDQDLIDQIKNDDSFFPSEMDGENIGQTNNYYHDEKADCYAPYMFWDGWWNSPANSLRKKVVELIWSDPLVANLLDVNEVEGFEYWCRTFTPGQYLDIHVDEDTFAYAKDRTFNAPFVGCVWYGFSDNTGSFLELHDGRIEGSPENALEQEHIRPLLSPPGEVERIRSVPNRLVVFEAGRRIHNATAVTSGKRQVMVVNVWHKNSPPSALNTGDFYYEGV